MTLLLVTEPRKHVVPPSYVTSGNVWGMSDGPDDLAWTRLHEPWERLAWARSRDPRYQSKKDFAEAVGMKEHGYSAYERRPGSSKHTPLKSDKAIPWAKKLKVRWEWLLDGKGVPWLDSTEGHRYTAAQQRAAELLEGKEPDQQERIVEALEVLLKTGAAGQ